MIEYILFGVMFLVITEFVLYLITRKGKWNLSNFVLAKTISIFVGAVATAIGYTIYDEIGARRITLGIGVLSAIVLFYVLNWFAYQRYWKEKPQKDAETPNKQKKKVEKK